MVATVQKRFPGTGIVRVGHELRVNVAPEDWLSVLGTDYWISGGSADIITASGATNQSGLDSFGWTTTSLVHSNLVTGDFMSSSDDTPPHILTDALDDELGSPMIFGSYSHALAAAQLLGRLPIRIVAEFYAAFTVASANETASWIGFVRPGAGAMATVIISNGTNFLLRNAAGTNSAAGDAVSTGFHQWRMVVDPTTTSWYIDGVAQPTLPTVADQWPAGFGLHAGTTNRLGLAWAHVWYE